MYPCIPKTRRFYCSVFVLLLLLRFGAHPCFSQSPEIDSLKNLLKTSLSDTSRMSVLIHLGKNLQRFDPQQGIRYLEQAIEMAHASADTVHLYNAVNAAGSTYYYSGDLEKAAVYWKRGLQLAQLQKDSLKTGLGYSNMGILHETRGELKEAISAYERAIDLIQQSDPFTKAAIANNLGLVFEKQANYPKALQSFLEALSGFEALEHSRAIASVQGNIGMVFFKQRNFEEAGKYYFRSLAIEKKNKDLTGMANTYNNLGGLYESSGKLDSALFFHQKSLELKQRLGNEMGTGVSYNNLGIVQYRLGNFAESVRLQQKAYQIAQKMQNPSDQARTAADLGKALFKTGQQTQAERYLLEALTLSQQVGERENTSKVYFALYELYKARNDFRALDFHEKYVLLKDSLRNDEQTREITRLELQYQFDKEKEMLSLAQERNQAKLQSKLQRQQLIRNASLGGLAAGLIILLLLWRSYRIKQQVNMQLEVQKNALQYALNDREMLLKEIHHRVKNNLQIISSLLSLQSRHIDDPKAQVAIQDGRNRVNAMALIHKNLYLDEDLVSVDSVDYIGKLTDSLVASYSIDPARISISRDIDPLHLDVDTIIPLGLILNELISNALKYAFSQNPEGRLDLSLKKERQGLRLRVADNGCGLPADFDIDKASSLGFRLVKSFAQKLEGILSIQSDNGVQIEILIPNFK